MEHFVTTTPKGTNGFNISYDDELECATALLKLLPKGWNVDFSWSQILFTDVQYTIEEKEKTVYIVYNQNLSYWKGNMIGEIVKKIIK
jgi:hypothetical protein